LNLRLLRPERYPLPVRAVNCGEPAASVNWRAGPTDLVLPLV